jgi:LAGLIDADG DNA endonuclease family
MVLQTDSFPVQDVVKIINVLIIKWDLKCSIHFKRGNPIIYISSKSIKKLYPKLKPFVCKSLLYKFESKKKLNILYF